MISLCMIVKNEAANLSRCLESVQDWIDEIVVVDTGSTDRTIEIAEQYGAMVYHHPWENDFSKHRNQSLSYATGDWILILDADEEIKSGHGSRIRRIVSDCQDDVTKIYFIVKDIKENKTSMVSQSIRLFRNHVGIHYEGIVHNKIIAVSGKGIKSNIILYHHGYDLSPEEMDRKFHRTFNLLEKQLDENPDDLFALYNMATTLQKRNPEKCIEYGFRLLSLLKQKNNIPLFYINIFYVLAASFVQSNEIDKAIDICMEVIHIFPKYTDAYWILSECCFHKNDYAQVIHYGNQFFQRIDYYENHPEELSELFVYSYDQKHKVSLRLGLSYIYAEKWVEAVPHLFNYLKTQESKSDAITTILGHLKTHHSEYNRIKEMMIPLIDSDASTEHSRKPTLSLCMIVKNEEKILPRCLDSIKGCVDEIIMVDTGSTDKTVDIAKSYGVKVYYHSWENDFSKHRNQSIAYATGDWILILDADEALETGDKSVIKAAIAREDIDSVMVPVLNYFNNRQGQGYNNQVRLFRNRIGCRYEGIVHNKLVGFTRKAFYPITILHYGYDLSPEEMEAKYKRTARLLKQKISKNPDDYVARSQLSANYAGCGKFGAAVEEGIRSIQLADKDIEKGGDVNLWTHFIVSSSYVNLDQLKNAETYAHKALEICPVHLDSFYILSIIYHALKDWKPFKKYSGNYLNLLTALKEEPEKFGNMVNTSANEAWRIHIGNGDFYLDQGDMDRAGQCYDLAVDAAPDPGRCHEIISVSYKHHQLWDLAERHCQQALEINAASRTAMIEMADIHSLKGNQEEYADIMDKLRQMETYDPAVLAAIGRCDLEQGRYETAINTFEKAIEKLPEDPNLHVNLALACRQMERIDEAIAHNRMAISVDDKTLEAFINLGNIYYDTDRLDYAVEMYERAVDIDPGLVDVRLRLARIGLMQGDVEACIAACDTIFKNLDIAINKSVGNLNDLADVFLLIADGLRRTGQFSIARQAMEIAAGINPNLDPPAVSNETTRVEIETGLNRESI